MEENITGIDDSLFDNYIPLAIPMLPPLGSKLSLFQEDKVAKPLTAEQEINNSINNSRVQTDYDNPIFTTSIDSVERYQDPLIQYRPGVDMEQIYAHAKPFTWGDSATKFYKTFKNHIGSSFQTAGSMISSLANGESILDNDFSEHMAMLTENLELEIPQYKTAYERDNPFALDNFFDSTLKSILPSAGTALGGIADMLIGHAVATLATPLTGGLSGTAGNAALFAKDAMVIKNIFSAGYKVSKALNTAAKIKNVRTATQMLGTAMFYANSEAALQAKMNENSFLEGEKKKYFDATGVMPQGEALEKLKEKGASLSKETYAMNLALISLSSMVQFPALLNGKFSANISKSLPITFEKGGKAIKGSFTKKGFTDFLESAGSEGAEEFFQGVIDASTTDYYSNTKGKDRVSAYMDGIGSRLNQEGLLEFVGGAIIGGGMSAGGSLQNAISGKQSKITDEYINQYNSSTEALKKSFIDSEINLENISKSITDREDVKLESSVSDEIYNIAKTSYNNSTLQPRRDYLMDLKNLPIEEFNAFMGNKFTEEQQHAYVDQTIREFNTAASILEGVEAKYNVNPFINDSAYNKIFGDLPFIGDGDRNKIEAQIWEQYKEVFSKSVFTQISIESKINEQEQPFREVYGDSISDILSPNLPQAVLDYKSRLKKELVIEVDGRAKNAIQAKLDNLDGKSVADQYTQILTDLGITNPIEKQMIKQIITQKAINKAFLDKNKKLQSKAGQLKEIKKLADYYTFLKDPLEEAEKKAEESSEATVTKEADDSFTVKDSEGNPILKTTDEGEAKAAALEVKEKKEMQEPVVNNVGAAIETRMKSAMQAGRASTGLIQELLEKEITGIPFSQLENEFILQFKDQYDLVKANNKKSTEQTQNNRRPDGRIIGGKEGWKIRFNLNNLNQDHQKVVDWLDSYFESNEGSRKREFKGEGTTGFYGFNESKISAWKLLSGGDINENEFTIYIGSNADTLKFIEDVKKSEIISLLDRKKQTSTDVEVSDGFFGRVDMPGLPKSIPTPRQLSRIFGRDNVVEEITVNGQKYRIIGIHDTTSIIRISDNMAISGENYIDLPKIFGKDFVSKAVIEIAKKAYPDFIGGNSTSQSNKKTNTANNETIQKSRETELKENEDYLDETYSVNSEKTVEEVINEKYDNLEQEEVNKVKRKDGVFTPESGKLFMVGSRIGNRYRVQDNNVFIYGIDILKPDDAQDIDVETTPIEISIERVLEMLGKSDKPYLLQLFRDSFGVEAAEIKLSYLDQYIKENKLSLEEETIIKNLNKSKLIKIEC